MVVDEGRPPGAGMLRGFPGHRWHRSSATGAPEPRGSPALDPGSGADLCGNSGAARSGPELRDRARRASASRRRLPAAPPRPLVRPEPERWSPRRQAPARAGRGAGLRLSLRGRREPRRRTLRMAGPGRGSLPASSPRTQGEPAGSVRRALHTEPRAPQAPGDGRPLPALSPPPRREVEGLFAVPGVPRFPALGDGCVETPGGWRTERNEANPRLAPGRPCDGGSKPWPCPPCR